MKRILWLLGMVCFLSGCTCENPELQEALAFREKLLAAYGCQFAAEITADYGDSLHSFSMDCRGDETGEITFEVVKPVEISGIRGTIGDSGGRIRFEEEAIYFPLLTDDLPSPAGAPWIFLKTLRSGCIASVCTEESLLHMTMDDSYAENDMILDIWISGEQPIRADILCNSRRILSMDIRNFAFS